jgi:hypothetical protein
MQPQPLLEGWIQRSSGRRGRTCVHVTRGKEVDGGVAGEFMQMLLPIRSAQVVLTWQTNW